MNKLSKRMVLITVIIMDLLVGMELDLFVPSFPELQSHFGLTPFLVEALLSVNFLGYCISLFCVGILADHYGRKPIIILGFSIFILGSILCLWAPIYSVMLVGRFLQGFGIASPAILSFLIIADMYPLQKQQFYMALMNGVKNASIAAAPVIGSYISLHFHWQGNFRVLLILGILCFLMTFAFIPRLKIAKPEESSELLGYVPLLRSKPLLLLMMQIIFMFTPYWIFVGISPLLYMGDLGVSLTHFGFYQGVLALAFALGSVSYGFMINKFNQKNMLHGSNLIFILSFVMIMYLSLTNNTHPVLITASLLLFTIGQIVPSTIIFPLCLNYIPTAKGRISGLVGTGSLILQSVGLQIAGLLYAHSFRNVGMIIAFFILMTAISLYLILKSREITISQKHEA